MHASVCIIGAGPAGLLLSQLLHLQGIDSIILERQTREHVESRIRAGILEDGTVQLLRKAGVGARLDRLGLPHDGIKLAVDGEMFRVDLRDLTHGAGVMVYGQTEVTRDLIEAVLERSNGEGIIFEAADVALHDVDTDEPVVTWREQGEQRRLTTRFIAGCDGFHGPSRQAIPEKLRTVYERIYPFGWLGILAEVPPCADELIYANHRNGFALASMRSATRSRYYIQVSAEETLDQWPDARLWDEIGVRLGAEAAGSISCGPAIEKSIAPLRSFVSEPMQYGRLFLAGDAAHIVPPCGAKGLNLAASDVGILAEAFKMFFKHGDSAGLENYGKSALARVWNAERFSWWFTTLTHRFPGMDQFQRKMQQAEMNYIRSSRAAQTTLAENYVGWHA